MWQTLKGLQGQTPMDTEGWLFGEETSGAEGKEPKDHALRNKDLNQFINYRSKSQDLQFQ